MFGPAAIRIHPTFTQLRDWSGHGKPDGIEATLEVQDQFDEPIRATGRVMFELYDYQKNSPQVRGRRLGGPWIASLNTKAAQQDRWNSALRAYTFQLTQPEISTKRYYVLTAQFDLNNPSSATKSTASSRPAGRLFDQLIIAPETGEGGHGRFRANTRNPGR